MAQELLKVRMNVGMAGEGFGYIPGETVDIPAELARALCALPEEAPRADPVGWKLTPEKPSTATAGKRSKAATARNAKPDDTAPAAGPPAAALPVKPGEAPATDPTADLPL